MSGEAIPSGEVIRCTASDAFQHWMSRAGGSLAITTYQAGKVALIGWDGRQVSVLMRQFDKPMGLAARDGRLALATRHEVLVFANAPLLAHDYLEAQPGRYDALWLPRAAWHTGDLNVHDLALADDGLWLVNTRFSCLATVSDQFSFVPRWKPPFISELVPEDRCHLNGLALIEGRPRYVTALGRTDTVGGWRPGKTTGGLLIDIEQDQVLLEGLSMPHSPRWHQQQLWLLNSGAGELCQVDPARGQRTVVCSLPGYLRGLAFAGNYALVGMSQIREQHIFGGLPLQERFSRLLCGVAVVDLGTGRQEALLEFTSGCQELFEVQFLHGALRPNILNLDRPAARQAFTAPEFSYWLRSSTEIPPRP